MSNDSYYDKVQKKEEKLTEAIVELMERSGFEIDRVSIEENNRGPDVVASYENGDVVVEIKAFHREKGSLHSAFDQVRGYAEGDEEKWVVTTSDVEPMYIPNDISLFLGKDILAKLNRESLDTWGVEWVRDAEVKKEPTKFVLKKDIGSFDEDSSSEFLTAREMDSIDSGDSSPLKKDELANKIVDCIKEGYRTLPSISEETGLNNQIVESKLKFLEDSNIIGEKE
ncbi:hypothetical protein AKJ50_02405 [candidate division MSBL1 archaeon SCGC-AAA382A13]|uniref:Uncharacterized protein n=1 Tax=candidate division MSBL1 archaeon SCGC-AAA382A13 TaxID=1698279 RepID=A0A133VDD3_9EURY|nr:hypothetical protein AKJ50_02405 [candidate division MSBL1 archaeon SCGC-AAA382A13]PTD94424.1 hypothetical protein C9439_02590 [archaeon SCG-AAA382B04]